MRVRLGRWQLVFVLASTIGCGSGDPLETGFEELTRAGRGLREGDFEAPLDRDFIRSTNAYLDDRTFEEKWSASLESRAMFMRAYPGAYHRDLSRLPETRIPGREGLCFGDPHPENFGFLRIEGTSRFGYNDLDDAGYCPVILDAARYFAVLRLMFDDKDLRADVLETYVDTLKDASRATTISDALLPDWDDELSSKLAKYTSGDRIVRDADHEDASPRDRAAIEAAFDAAEAPLFRGRTLLDVVRVLRGSGGSGGLSRFWLLAQSGTKRTILEVKGSVTPGTELGRHARTLDPETRLDTLQRAFWERSAGESYVTLGGKRFLVRDRFARASVQLSKLGKRDLENVLRAEASLLALLHADALAGVKKDDVRAWLDATSKTLASRWSQARDDGR